MLNYETILSSYDDRLTLLQWLKKVEAALAGASLNDFAVSYEGNGNYKFKAHFADGSEVESNLVALQGVENVYIAAGNELHFVLTDGEDINAGNILLNGTLTLDSLAVNNGISCDTLEQASTNWGGSFSYPTTIGGSLSLTNIYNRFEVINGVLYVISNIKIYNGTSSPVSMQYLCDAVVDLPQDIASKIIDFAGNPVSVSGGSAWITSVEGTIKETANVVPTSYGVKSGVVVRTELYNNGTPNRITISIATDATMSFSPSKAVYITTRAALTLL